MSVGSPKLTTCMMMLLALAGFTQPGRRLLASGESGGQPLVRGISIHDGPGGAVVIDISITHPVPYHTTQLAGPERLVVDLEGARDANLRNEYPAQSPLLERVRTSQWKSHPAVFRIVADLKGNPGFSLEAVDSGLRVELKSRAEAQRRAHGQEKVEAPSPAGSVEPGPETAHQGSSPDKVFQVHRFQDLSASLTAPVLPPNDQLVAVAE